MDRFVLVLVLTMFIHLVLTMNYSIRLAGLRTRRLLTALSIFNVINLAASAANTVQAPLLTSLVEHAIMAGALQTGVEAGNQLLLEQVYMEQLDELAGQLRLAILAATIGALSAALLTPTFINLFTRAIRLFEATGSIPAMFGRLFLSFFRGDEGKSRLFSLPSWRNTMKFTRQKMLIPKKLPVINVLVTGIFTTGVLSSLYAGALHPDFRSTAAVLSVAVNSLAMVVVALAVEPKMSLITDEAMRGDRSETDIKQLIYYMVITRVAGSLLAQAFFLPCAYLIRCMVRVLAG